MNIIIANTREFDFYTGGVERVSVTLAGEFTRMGYEVYFVACIQSVFPGGYKPVAKQLLLPDREEMLTKANVEAFLQFVYLTKADIIINQAGNVMGFTKLCVKVKEVTGIKLISAIHVNPDYTIKSYLDTTFSEMPGQCGMIPWMKLFVKRFFPYKLRKIKKELRNLYRYVYRNSDKVVLLSEHFISVYRNVTELEEISRLTSIPNPVSYDIKTTIAGKKKEIIFVGRLNFEEKRPDRLLVIWAKIFRKYPDWKLVVVGDGPARDGLEKLAVKLKIEQLSFTGFQDPVPYYKRAAIICMTSTIEGFGMVLLEAAQFGVVPVAYDSFESLKDIIDTGVNGYRVVPFNSKQYRKCLTELMENRLLRSRMAAAAQTRVSDFNMERIAGKWVELFNELLQH